MRLAPKNWREFQHYKNRNPPWIRLQRKLLDDKDFQRLPIASRALAPMLWLLASESVDGVFDGSQEELAFRLRTSEKEIAAGLKPLIDKGFFIVVQGASSVLADCKQVAPESCSETETETETETVTLSRAAPPDGVADAVWKDFMAIRRAKRAPMTATALDGLRREAEKAGIGLEQALRMCCERGWQGFKADWLTGKAVVGITVPGPSGPDPELERLKAHKGSPPSLETLAKMAQLRKGALQ